jgi:hypothetical protein
MAIYANEHRSDVRNSLYQLFWHCRIGNMLKYAYLSLSRQAVKIESSYPKMLSTLFPPHLGITNTLVTRVPSSLGRYKA